MKFFINILIIISCFSLSYFSQQRQGNFPGGSISGKVIDSPTKHTIEYANVIVFSLRDSSMVTGGVTNSEGLFNLSIDRPGNFKVEIRFIGYDTEVIETSLKQGNFNIDLGEIQIHPTALLLENIVVEGDRSPITYQIDKKVIIPDQMQTVISGNAADVLANVPSVQVDIEGNVSLRGSQSFTVLIDGKPSVLDPQDALQQIAAISIDKIEIITNPTAKYDPEGNAGIINIIMKKNLSPGLNGIVNANAGMYDNYGGDFLVNYQNNNIRTNFGLAYNQRFFPGEQIQNNIYNYSNNPTTLNSIGDVNRGRTSLEGRGNIEFVLGSSDILSFGGRIGKMKGERTADQNYTQFTEQNPEEFNYLSSSLRNHDREYYSFSSNYTHIFGLNNHQLLGELFFSSQSSEEITTTSEFTGGDQFSGRKTLESGPSSNFRGKLDYTLPVSESGKFEAGYQGQYALSDETTGLYDYSQISNEYEIQTQFSNLNNFTNSEQALYALYSDRVFDLSLQGGLRAEYTYRTIEVPTQNASFNIDRIDYFPSLHTSYKFNPVTSLMASYTRRIERPRGWALEPFPTWIDANNVRIGNPNLLPEFIDSYETGVQTFIGQASLTAEVYYKITNNKIEAVRTAIDDNVTLTTFANVGSDYSLGLEMMLNFDPLSFWNLNLMGNAFNYLIEGTLNDVPFSQESFNWQTRMNNIFKLWSSTQVQFNLIYNSPTVSSQGRMEEYFSSDLSVRQELITNVLAVTLQVRDVFGTAKREFTSEGSNFYNYNRFNMDSPTLILNVRYTFNNYKPKRDGRGEDNGGFEGGEDF